MPMITGIGERLSLIVFAFLLTTFVACDNSVVIDEHVKLNDNRWELNNVVKLEANIVDTVNPHNIYINVRNAGSYGFSNLYVFLNTFTPDGRMARDTVELILADERGEWMGDGMGDIWDNKILFKKGFVFPQSGNYKFELEQAMRMNPLPGIMDVGICIEKVEK
jgi:gliding motility-associated lipoprotein GldH